MFVDLNMCGIQAKKKGSLSLAVDTSQLEKGTSNIISIKFAKVFTDSNFFTAGQVCALIKKTFKSTRILQIH